MQHNGRMLLRGAFARKLVFVGMACAAAVGVGAACKTTVEKAPEASAEREKEEEKKAEEKREEERKEEPPVQPLTGLCKAHSALAKKLGIRHLVVGVMTEGSRPRYETAIQNAPYGLKYIYLSERAYPGGPLENCPGSHSWWGCWNEGSGPKPGGRLRNLFSSAEAAGQIPMVVYYTFYRTIGEGALTREMLVNVDNNIRDYFDDFRFMLQVVNEYQQRSNKPVMLHIEPDLWGYAQQGAAGRSSPRNVRAEVRSTSRGDCGAMEDNFAGFGKCMLQMARTYAPLASVGLMASGWSTGVDINLEPRLLNVEAIAHSTAAYLNHFRLGEDLGDFLVVEFSDRDADFYRENPDNEPRGSQDRWYRTAEGPYPNFPRTFAWGKVLAETLELPLVWWQIPMGNAKLENGRLPKAGSGWERGQWKDNRVDHLFLKSSLEEVVKNHGIALAFGPGREDQTSPTTDGGNLAAQVRTYAQAPQPLFCAE